MEKLTKEELSRLKLFGRNILIQLPPETDDTARTLKSGIVASFIYSDKEKYAPVQGVVVKRSPMLTTLRDGDHVFFHYLCWGNAQHTDEQFRNGHYDGTKIGIECEGVKYLLMSETEVFFAKRGERFVSVNDYLLLRSIPKEIKEELLKDARGYTVGKVNISETQNGLVTGINTEENYRLDIAEVVCVPEDMGVRVGDIIFPEIHWDVPIEYDVLETVGETLYYTHRDIILAKRQVA